MVLASSTSEWLENIRFIEDFGDRRFHCGLSACGFGRER